MQAEFLGLPFWILDVLVLDAAKGFSGGIVRGGLCQAERRIPGYVDRMEHEITLSHRFPDMLTGESAVSWELCTVFREVPEPVDFLQNMQALHQSFPFCPSYDSTPSKRNIVQRSGDHNAPPIVTP